MRGCDRRCVKGCPVRAFEEALDAPVLASEICAQEAEDARFAALLRGEVPTS